MSPAGGGRPESWDSGEPLRTRVHIRPPPLDDIPQEAVNGRLVVPRIAEPEEYQPASR